MAESAIITRVFTAVQEIPAQAWNDLLARQPVPTPFMRHEYLAALESSASAPLETGWQPCFVTLWQGDELVAACPLYAKNHSSGEYIELCKLAQLDQLSRTQEDERKRTKRRRRAYGQLSWSHIG